MAIVSHHLSRLFDEEPDKTCFVVEDNQVIFSSKHRGVKPLIDFYVLKGVSKKPLTVVDKIMGKGAVMLAKLIGAAHIITPVISKVAFEFALEQELQVEYSKVVPYVINRTNDGPCPIEQAVTNITDIQEGYIIIQETLEKLRNKRG